MNRWFNFSDFIRVWDRGTWVPMPVPNRGTIDQIVNNHMFPMNQVRQGLGIPLRIHRCYATVDYEKSRGRDGTSQHCFRAHGYGEKSGACDIDFWNESRDGSAYNYSKFAEKLIASPYSRICWYPNMTFFHCDYKSVTRQYFWYDGSSWHYISNKDQEFLNKVKQNF